MLPKSQSNPLLCTFVFITLFHPSSLLPVHSELFSRFCVYDDSMHASLRRQSITLSAIGFACCAIAITAMF